MADSVSNATLLASTAVIPAEWTEAARIVRRRNASRLEDWEREHCEWLANAETSIPYSKQAIVCSGLAGREVTVAELKKLRDNRAWRSLKYSIKAQRQEKIDEARSIMNDTLPKAATLAQRAITEMLDDKAPVDARAVPPLVAPFLDRAFPKKTETETRSTVVTINLSADQLRGLTAPTSRIEAEDAEVVSIEDAT